MKWIAWSPILMLGCGLITATQRSVQGVPGAILAGQAEVNEVVAWGSLCPVVSWSFSFEVLTSIDFDGVEPIGVHPRWIKHDVVCSTVPEKKKLIKTPESRHSNIPMCDISLMQKLDTLAQKKKSDQLTFLVRRRGRAHFADLCEESYKLAIRAEMGLVERSQVWHHHQFLIKGVG